MKSVIRILAINVTGLGLLVCLMGADWLQFRGPYASGVATPTDTKSPYADDDLELWKIELPGRGLSGPIVIGDKVVVTASSGFRQDRLHVICLDRKSGKTVWHRQFWATGRTMCHPKMCNATPTPSSDGKHIFAFYSSNDLACLDLDGNLLWYRGITHDFPNASNSLGMASSPIVIGNALIVQTETDADSFASGIDTHTGKSLWKKVRPKRANWTSPTMITEKGGRTLALLQSSRGLDAIIPKTGELVWSYEKGASTIPSSVVVGDSVLIPSNGLTALRHIPGKEPEQLWNQNRLGPGTASPLSLGDRVFVVNSASVLQSADILTGSIHWRLRLKGPFSSTPVAAGKSLYFVNEEGLLQIVDVSGEKGEISAEHPLGETVLGTPAIADHDLFVRSDKHLWKIAIKR
jgi:outer membrane protein assembly factor BamB